MTGFSEPGLVGATELPWEIFVPDVQIFCRGPGWDLIEALNMNTWETGNPVVVQAQFVVRATTVEKGLCWCWPASSHLSWLSVP